ncbi:hypothetical protein WJX73_001417 [Symbiochloris irregularis]|uniref:Uncharacterized protein n=1 Tax=Symbiochloris irregularis TaxID=706552 RepID=A0AAW1PF25_9CHLO
MSGNAEPVVIQGVTTDEGVRYFCPVSACTKSFDRWNPKEWAAWSDPARVQEHVRDAKKAPENYEGAHSGLPKLLTKARATKYATPDDAHQARKQAWAANRARGSEPSSEQAAAVLLAAVLGMSDRASALEALAALQNASGVVRDTDLLACIRCLSRLRFVQWKGRCVTCKEPGTVLESLITRDQADDLMKLMQSCKLTDFPEASLADLQSQHPSMETGLWTSGEPIDVKAFVQGLQPKSWPDDDLQGDLWSRVRDELLQGNYVLLNHFPVEPDGAMEMFFKRLLEPYWDDWFRGDVDLQNATTVFLSPSILGKRSKKDGTHCHFDRTASLNIAVATSAEDVGSVLALWLLIFPTALDKFSAWCAERGKTLEDLAANYALVQKLIATRVGPSAVPDYFPISVCALNCAINARLKRRRG